MFWCSSINATSNHLLKCSIKLSIFLSLFQFVLWHTCLKGSFFLILHQDMTQPSNLYLVNWQLNKYNSSTSQDYNEPTKRKNTKTENRKFKGNRAESQERNTDVLIITLSYIHISLIEGTYIIDRTSFFNKILIKSLVSLSWWE